MEDGSVNDGKQIGLQRQRKMSLCFTKGFQESLAPQFASHNNITVNFNLQEDKEDDSPVLVFTVQLDCSVLA